MIQTALNNNSKTRKIISEKFIDPGFEYWFTNHEHIRSPFPTAIRVDLKEKTSVIFFEWIDGLKKTELNAMKDDEFAEMFETILFNEAMKLVEDEDMKLTIAYPFLPRLGDQVNHGQHGKGTVTVRKEIISKDNKKLFELSVLSQQTGQTWETQFELPN
jgi:hypothetical protein